MTHSKVFKTGCVIATGQNPVLEGPGIYDAAPIDYVAEDRFMSGISTIYAAIHEGDYTIPDAAPNEIPSPLGGGVGGLADGPPPDLPGLPTFNYEDFSPRRILSYAPYTTRLIIYRPKDLRKFSGNVVIEIIHPSGGGSTPMWNYFNEVMSKSGDIYIGVQHPRNFRWLQYHKPQRYAPLNCADFSQIWGMLSDAARVIKEGAIPGLANIKAKRAYLTGYSFTGLIATSYAKQHHNVNRLDGNKPVFDGYPIGTGFGPMPPMDVPVMIGANQYISYNDTDEKIPTSSPSMQARKHRVDFDADGAMTRRRRYELAGFQHAPGPEAESLAHKAQCAGSSMGVYTNGQKVQQIIRTLTVVHFMKDCFATCMIGLSAELRHPRSPLIETANGKLILDELGNAKGGLRFPEVQVPVATYQTGERECRLRGWMIPFKPEKLREIYGSWDNYLLRFNEAVDELVRQRYILPWRGERMKLAAARNIPDF